MAERSEQYNTACDCIFPLWLLMFTNYISIPPFLKRAQRGKQGSSPFPILFLQQHYGVG